MIAACLHLARTVCRRAERTTTALQSQGDQLDPQIIVYLNRLSDYLFVMARYANLQMGEPDKTWKK